MKRGERPERRTGGREERRERKDFPLLSSPHFSLPVLLTASLSPPAYPLAGRRSTKDVMEKPR
jgi:hypothetical protein